MQEYYYVKCNDCDFKTKIYYNFNTVRLYAWRHENLYNHITKVIKA